MGYIKDPGSVQAGSTGTLYKFTKYNADDINGWFQWVPKNSVASTTSPKNINTKEPEGGLSIVVKSGKFYEGDTKTKKIEKVVSPPKKYNWQSLMSPPPSYQTVLIKFKNGLCTTAYYTPTGDWKSEMDRKKLSGGIALKEVSQWKFVDLE